MGERRILYAIAESCPFDVLLVKDMRRAVNDLVQLNMRRFRVPDKTMTKYSALDIMKQALELLFEFSPSEKNYREAMRTIQVYSEGDKEMLQKLRTSFSLIANAIYNAYSGQRHAESLAPEILFLQGIPFDPTELQQSFRYVGVKPPEVSPPTVKRIVFLDEGFEPYELLLEGKAGEREIAKRREKFWAERITSVLNESEGTALIRSGREHLDQSTSPFKRLMGTFRWSQTGALPILLRRSGIRVEVLHKIANISEVFGRNHNPG
jgi:hypothetical protein